MDNDDVAFAGITRQAALIRSGEISSTKLVELYLSRIEALDPHVNAFRVVLADDSSAEAGRRAGEATRSRVVVAVGAQAGRIRSTKPRSTGVIPA